MADLTNTPEVQSASIMGLEVLLPRPTKGIEEDLNALGEEGPPEFDQPDRRLAFIEFCVGKTPAQLEPFWRKTENGAARRLAPWAGLILLREAAERTMYVIADIYPEQFTHAFLGGVEKHFAENGTELRLPVIGSKPLELNGSTGEYMPWTSTYETNRETRATALSRTLGKAGISDVHLAATSTIPPEEAAHRVLVNPSPSVRDRASRRPTPITVLSQKPGRSIAYLDRTDSSRTHRFNLGDRTSHEAFIAQFYGAEHT